MKNNNLPNVIRLLGATGGFLGGGIIGTILLIIFMGITNATLGLDNIWPFALLSAAVGGVLGFISPKFGKYLAEILNYFP